LVGMQMSQSANQDTSTVHAPEREKAHP
jgi:hypothetical protein